MEILPLFNAGRIRLLDNARVIAQLAGLIRKASPSGRSLVDHLPGSSDDCANSAAGALVLATAKPAGPRFFWG
jgi:hypothetical protein